MEKSVDECISKGVLEDILRKNRAEVMDVLLTVYNEKQHNRTLREEGRELGRSEGERNKILQQTRKHLEKGRTAEEISELLFEDVSTIKELIREIKEDQL